MVTLVRGDSLPGRQAHASPVWGEAVCGKPEKANADSSPRGRLARQKEAQCLVSGSSAYCGHAEGQMSQAQPPSFLLWAGPGQGLL